MKVAVIHDWLVTYGGADRVLEQILTCYPEADLFSVVDFLPPGERQFIFNKLVNTSFVQHLPFAQKSFRWYFPLLPLAVEQFDLSMYDLVISNSHSFAKGVITGADQVHICFCHSPARYAWDLQNQYLQESGLEEGLFGWVAKWLLHKARIWDIRTANGVNEFIANSHFIARRIWKIYRREATVIYPPVDVDAFTLQEHKENYYLTVSRLVPYKKVNLIVEAFNRMPEKKLVVIGDGPQIRSLKAIANKNVQILGFQDTAVVRRYMKGARAFVFAAQEDFGICVAEAQACGTPVIAYGKGGVPEIVRDLSSEHPTGILFNEQSADAIMNAICFFENNRKEFDAKSCRRNAVRFSVDRFRTAFIDFCQRVIAQSRNRVQPTALSSQALAQREKKPYLGNFDVANLEQ